MLSPFPYLNTYAGAKHHASHRQGSVQGTLARVGSRVEQRENTEGTHQENVPAYLLEHETADILYLEAVIVGCR
jgi:hypothetical protein